MFVRTWLYSKDGGAVIVDNIDKYNDLLNKGWKDTPDKLKGETPKPNQQHNNQGKKK